MPKLKIDNQDVEVAPGGTILDAARLLGLAIPTLCHREGRRPNTSCFVCVVKLRGRDRLVPSCATVAEDGMEVESETPEVLEARRSALELLLSDHLGDCLAPCQCACPAQMDIPRMIREIREGRDADAIRTVKRDIPLAAVLGRICPAPCEKACRRGDYDGAVGICLLKRHAADVDLAQAEPYRPLCAPATGRRVAIVGAGPAGLTTAYYLLCRGHSCTVFEERPQPGGALIEAVPADRLPRAVVAAECRVIERMGAEFRLGVRVGADLSWDALRCGFDAVVLATGKTGEDGNPSLGVPLEGVGFRVDRKTMEAGVAGVFAAGGAVRALRMAVRAVADGKHAAASVDQFLAGRPVAGPHKAFSTHTGRLSPDEMARYVLGAAADGRVRAGGAMAGYQPKDAVREAARCLHCDCRRQHDCRLRLYGECTHAVPHRFRGHRREYQRRDADGSVIYEPGKCVDCGLCVQIAETAREPLGLTFIGRGFDVRVGVPFDEPLSRSLAKVAAECVAACPTGALAFYADTPAANPPPPSAPEPRRPRRRSSRGRRSG